MITKLYQKEHLAVEPATYLPSVSLLIPFEPRITSKGSIEAKLKRALTAVEKDLFSKYPKSVVKSAVSKLKSITGNLDYNTNKKSVAIFLEPFMEKVYYLNIAVKEKAMVGGLFSGRELVQSKEEEKKYVVLALTNDSYGIYLGTKDKLNRLLYNLHVNADSPAKKIQSVSDSECQQKKRLRYIDKSLSIILKSYPYPLFMVANEKNSADFLLVSENRNSFISCIKADIGQNEELEVKTHISAEVKHWNKIKEKDILNQLDKAEATGKLVIGITDVWKAARERKVNLLVVEKDYSVPAYLSDDEEMLYSDAIPIKNAVPVQDAVDDAIEKVLAGGGRVEFVENGMLKEYMHIALF